MLEQLTLIEAGQVLGISPDAVRMRIKRGSMQAEKDEDGRWLVWVDVEQAAAEREAEREPDATGEREPEREAEHEERRIIAIMLTLLIPVKSAGLLTWCGAPPAQVPQV
jgi:hypothetical protein